eukprot:COSAG01_NODE_7867_length_3016_cov_19.757971_1_plen_216_part_00
MSARRPPGGHGSLDSASYHKNLLNPWPTAGGKDRDGNTWKRASIIDWLKSRGQELGKTLITDAQCEPAGKGKPGLTLIKLFDIVKANMPKPNYEVYDIAEKYGHIIIFTPPYSPLSNPIEKIWAVIKNRIATSEERASNLSELAALLEGAVESITRKTWLGCYKKTREWEDKMSSRDDNFVAGTPTEALFEAGADEELEEEEGDVSDGGEDEDYE